MMSPFHTVGCMIAEHENFIEDTQKYISENKGNSKLKGVINELKEEIKEHRKMLAPLYKIRNSFYYGGK